jgi:glycyl-tRNA synthetase
LVRGLSKIDTCQKIMELAKRRGFFWPSYELYGGEGGFIDYGPLGSLLKRRVEEMWIDTFIRKEGVMLIDTPLVTPSAVFEASGHTSQFTDPITTCEKCGRKWRADHLLEEQAKVSGEGMDVKKLGAELRKLEVRCPESGGVLGETQAFNELFKTSIGPYSENVGYGRPETAQGIFSNFRRLYELARNRLPFGVAQVGRCVRNEISPRQGPIRLRELTIMEFEFFFDPEEECSKIGEVEGERLRLMHETLIRKGSSDPEEVTVREALDRGYIKSPWNAYFMVKAKRFVAQLGVADSKQFFIEKLPEERAHYSAQTYDQVVEMSRWGFIEVSGHAWRTDYDLKMHMVHSGEDLRAFTQYDEPRQVKKLVLKPNKKLLAEEFKAEMPQVMKLLEVASAEKVKEALEGNGYYVLKGDVGEYRITANQLSVEEATVKETGRRFIPHVVEPSFGSDRLAYMVLEYAYSEVEGRVVLRLPRELAPIQVAVFPLLSKAELQAKAKEIYDKLLNLGFTLEYDAAGTIGKRYARMDEAGTPLAVTVDYSTLEEGTVTLRDRDSWRQVRVKVDDLPSAITRFLNCEVEFADLGEAVDGS